jgi:hydroxymethylpyrimidine pyrophosphatase-like HAD family hydrolase
MIPKLFAFDLDGTLLNSGKRVSGANAAALREIRAGGAFVALASGRLGAGVRRYAPVLGIDPALVTLNGAEVFTASGKDAPRIYYAPLGTAYAKYLAEYGNDKPVAVNFYYQDILYTAWSPNPEKLLWTRLYTEQTGVEYCIINDFSKVAGISPSKIIFVGEPSYIDRQEKYFR